MLMRKQVYSIHLACTSRQSDVFFLCKDKKLKSITEVFRAKSSEIFFRQRVGPFELNSFLVVNNNF